VGKLLELKQRIRAVESIQVVTRTLATVAAAKLSRTRRRAAGMRAYAQSIRTMLYHQQAHMARTGLGMGALSSLLRQREPVGSVAVLVITADRGMCGGYNLEACRCGLALWERNKAAGCAVKFVLKGSRGLGYYRKHKADIVHHEGWWRGGFRPQDVERLLGVLLGLYRTGAADAVYTVYTEFHSPIHRVPRAIRMLPVETPAGGPAERIDKWHHEPAFRDLLDELLAMYLRVQLCDVLLESYASEHGARMITMQEAAERAGRMLQEYRVKQHRLRREEITIDLLQTLFASRAAEEASLMPARRV
jgi:F-type H+-transporting ATPase subunit gamma